MRKWALFVLVVALGVATDALTKAWALEALVPGATRRTLNGLLPLTLGFNRGIAFGLHAGAASRILFTTITLAMVVGVVWVYRSTPPQQVLRRWALALMCAGALGNLLDRLLRADGVVDFIGPYDLRLLVWPVFNVADILVVVGVAAFGIALLAGRPHGDAQRPPP